MLSFCLHGELARFVTEDMMDETNRKKYIDLINEKEEMNLILIKYYLNKMTYFGKRQYYLRKYRRSYFKDVWNENCLSY